MYQHVLSTEFIIINVAQAAIKTAYKKRYINAALLLTMNYNVSVGVKKSTQPCTEPVILA
jgi:hypothetical protein